MKDDRVKNCNNAVEQHGNCGSRICSGKCGSRLSSNQPGSRFSPKGNPLVARSDWDVLSKWRANFEWPRIIYINFSTRNGLCNPVGRIETQPEESEIPKISADNLFQPFPWDPLLTISLHSRFHNLAMNWSPISEAYVGILELSEQWLQETPPSAVWLGMSRSSEYWLVRGSKVREQFMWTFYTGNWTLWARDTCLGYNAL